MADKKIVDLGTGVALGANDSIVLVQGNETLKISGQDVAWGVKTIADLADKSYVDSVAAGGTGEALEQIRNELDQVKLDVAEKLPANNFGLEFWSQLANVTTYHIREDSNLYWTQQRFDDAFANKSTSNLTEGSNLYFTNTRGRSSVFDSRDIITFQNGGEVGNAQYQHMGSPFLGMDIYSPASHDWVQLNYDDRNYVWVTDSFAGIDITGSNGSVVNWLFDENGVLTLPAGGDIVDNYGNSVLGGSTGATALSQLSDVYITSPTSGQVLKFNGTKWVNGTDSTGSGGGGSIGDDPTFNSVSTSTLNVKNIAFTGTGAVNISSGNDLNLSAVGQVAINGSAIGNLAFADNIAFSELINVNGANGPVKISIGKNSGFTNQGERAIALGEESGRGGQGRYSIAVGFESGYTGQGTSSVAIGGGAGKQNQGETSVAIGSVAGNTDQATCAVAVGRNAGSSRQGENSVAIGVQAGSNDQSTNSVAIGSYSGSLNQSASATAIGWQAGQTNQGVNSVAIGAKAGESSQGHHAIAIGASAGWINQPNYTIILNATGSAINGVGGQEASFYVAPIRSATATDYVVYYNPITKEVTYGPAPAGSVSSTPTFNSVTISGVVTNPDHAATKAYVDSQVNDITSPAWNTIVNISNEFGPTRIALGRNAGGTTDADGYGGYGGYGAYGGSSYAIAIGNSSGQVNQGGAAVSIGVASGFSNQGDSAIAIGLTAGNVYQGAGAVAIGESAGNSDQGANAVAIGNTAGYTSQGINAIAIGKNAGKTNQPAGSIVISATGNELNGSAAGLYIDPIRSATATDYVAYYNPTTKEVTYGPAPSGGSSVGDNPIFESVTTTDLNVQNVTFTGTGAVTITSGNDLNLVAAGDIRVNGQKLFSPFETNVSFTQIGVQMITIDSVPVSAGKVVEFKAYMTGSDSIQYPLIQTDSEINYFEIKVIHDGTNVTVVSSISGDTGSDRFPNKDVVIDSGLIKFRVQSNTTYNSAKILRTVF